MLDKVPLMVLDEAEQVALIAALSASSSLHRDTVTYRLTA